MGRQEKAELTCQTRLHLTHLQNSQGQVWICKLISPGPLQRTAPGGQTAMRLSSLFQFQADDAR